MAESIVMPRLGMAMVEGTVSGWLKREGEQVSEGEPLLEIETEKLNYTIEAPASGVLHIVAAEESVVPCFETLGVLAISPAEYLLVSGRPPAGEVAASRDVAFAADGAGAGAVAVQTGERIKASPAARRVAAELSVDISLVRGSGPEGRVVEEDVRRFAEASKTAPAEKPAGVAISPLAGKLAEEHGLDTRKIQGTGPGGRIVREDVLAAVEREALPARRESGVGSREPRDSAALPVVAAPTPAAATAAQDQRVVAQIIPLVGMRKAVADNMMRSLQTTAQVSISAEIDATELVDLRRKLLTQAERLGARISYNDFIVRSIIIALREWPIFNSAIEGNEIKIFENINMGVAVDIDDGLIVPVVHDADELSFVELSKTISRLAEKARNRSLTFDEVTGGTFTLSNVGAFDVVTFTPILNPPESAIIGVGGIVERPAVVSGQLAIRSMMTLNLTWDHRVANGVPACQFAQSIKRSLENPSILLV